MALIEGDMFRTYFSFTCVALVALAAGDPTNVANKDLKRLQGTWVMAALEVDGKLVPENKLGTTLIVKGNKYTTRVKDKEFTTTFTLHPAKSPPAIDMVFTEGDNKDKVLKGIYKIEGDTLKVCRGLSADKARPTQFGTWPNTGIFMVTWKRNMVT